MGGREVIFGHCFARLSLQKLPAGCLGCGNIAQMGICARRSAGAAATASSRTRGAARAPKHDAALRTANPTAPQRGGVCAPDVPAPVGTPQAEAANARDRASLPWAACRRPPSSLCSAGTVSLGGPERGDRLSAMLLAGPMA